MQNHNIDIPTKPSTGSALSYGWRKMKANFLIFFLAVLVIFVLNSIASGDDILVNGEVIEPSPLVDFILAAYWFLFVSVISYGADLIFLYGVRGDDVKIKKIAEGFNDYLNVVLAALLVFGLIGISLIVFIVPGVYVACRLAFVSYLVMDEKLDPIEAVGASWRITQGHAWKIFCLGFASIILTAIGGLLLIVGIFPAIMWVKASFAAMYLSITQQTFDNKQ